jgi:hypothetical protein
MSKHALVSVVGLILVGSILPLVLPNPYVIIRKQLVYPPYLWITVEAPEESKINESFTVTIEIIPEEKVYINSITIEFFNPSYKDTILSNTEISSKFVKTYNFKPENGGSFWCYIEYNYVVYKGTSFEKSYYGSFSICLTEIREKTYDELKVAYYYLKLDYDSLNSSYINLKWDYESISSSYDKLKANCDSLSLNYQNLKWKYESLNSSYNDLMESYSGLKKSYNELYEKFEEQIKRTMFFVLTTLMFASTTVYLAWKCRKLEKKQGKSR